MNKPIGRMTLRPSRLNDGQSPRIRLWTLPAPPPGSTQAKLLQHYQRVFHNIEALDARKAELKSSADLTEIGRERQALDFAFQTVMPDTLRGRRALQKAAQEVASKRAKLKSPKADPS